MRQATRNPKPYINRVGFRAGHAAACLPHLGRVPGVQVRGRGQILLRGWDGRAGFWVLFFGGIAHLHGRQINPAGNPAHALVYAEQVAVDSSAGCIG